MAGLVVGLVGLAVEWAAGLALGPAGCWTVGRLLRPLGLVRLKMLSGLGRGLARLLIACVLRLGSGGTAQLCFAVRAWLGVLWVPSGGWLWVLEPARGLVRELVLDSCLGRGLGVGRVRWRGS